MVFWNKRRKILLIELFCESKKGLYKEIRKKKNQENISKRISKRIINFLN